MKGHGLFTKRRSSQGKLSWSVRGSHGRQKPGEAGRAQEVKGFSCHSLNKGLDISSGQLGITRSFPVQEDCTQVCVSERSLGWLGGRVAWKGQVKDKGKQPWNLFQVAG